VFYYIAFQWSTLTGGDDGLVASRASPSIFGPFTIDILNNGIAFYYFVLVCFAITIGFIGLPAALAVRPHHDRDPRERAPRPLPGIPIERHIWIAFTLSCFFISLAGSLYALLKQFRRSEGAALRPFGHLVIMAVMAACAASGGRSWVRHLCRPARLPVEPYHQLDVLRRRAVRAGCPVLPPRGARGPAPEERDVSVLEVKNVSKSFAGSPRSATCRSASAGRAARRDRTQWRRQDHLLQSHQRPVPPTAGSILLRRPRRHQAAGPQAGGAGYWRATFQITEIFPELTVFEKRTIGAEVHRGLSPATLASAARSRRTSVFRIEKTLAQAGLEAKSDGWWAKLAHGDQRATEIAMALSLDPHLLLLDEPTAGMGDQETYRSPSSSTGCVAVVRLTIVLIEQTCAVVFHLADRISVLDQGGAPRRGHAEGIAKTGRTGRLSGKAA